MLICKWVCCLLIYCSILSDGYCSLCTVLLLVCLYVVFDFEVHLMIGSGSEQFGFLFVYCCSVLSMCLCIV